MYLEFLGLQEKPFSGMKSDQFAFGVLIYYLLFNQFPEGFFDLPSEGRPTLQGNWDPLITACLQYDAEKRPDILSKKLEPPMRKA